MVYKIISSADYNLWQKIFDFWRKTNENLIKVQCSFMQLKLQMDRKIVRYLPLLTAKKLPKLYMKLFQYEFSSSINKTIIQEQHKYFVIFSLVNIKKEYCIYKTTIFPFNFLARQYDLILIIDFLVLGSYTILSCTLNQVNLQLAKLTINLIPSLPTGLTN